MSRLRRYDCPHRVCFITCITFERRAILVENADLFWKAVRSLATRADFGLIAHVILPDHLHIIIDPGGDSTSSIMQRIKMSFGMLYRQRFGLKSGRVWQHRFWDHKIRDQADMNHHIDYIHYNPVNHGLVESPFGWENSSIHGYLHDGFYQKDWGLDSPIDPDGEYGE